MTPWEALRRCRMVASRHERGDSGIATYIDHMTDMIVAVAVWPGPVGPLCQAIATRIECEDNVVDWEARMDKFARDANDYYRAVSRLMEPQPSDPVGQRHGG